jgi:hypothetical protein
MKDRLESRLWHSCAVGIPQLRDSEDVAIGLRRRPGVRYSALAPNPKKVKQLHFYLIIYLLHSDYLFDEQFILCTVTLSILHWHHLWSL